MIHFPYAKINLGLAVVAKRPDGFHDIETIFYPIPLFDALEILPAVSASLTLSGLAVPGRPEDNILLRAWEMLKMRRPALAPLQILLHKAIPMGAGLGGGSSDAAQLLLMMNSLFDLKLSGDELKETAAALGSDCVFFLQQKACLGSGRGEKLEPVSLDLSGYDLLLVHPRISVSTAWAYSQIRPCAPVMPMKTLSTLPPEQWKEYMINAFEAPVFSAHPELDRVKSALYDAGAIYAAMTGSGSTLFGIFTAGTCPGIDVDQAYAQNFLQMSSSHPVL